MKACMTPILFIRQLRYDTTLPTMP